MKVLNKIALGLAASSLLFTVGCVANNTSDTTATAKTTAKVDLSKSVSEESLGLRKTNLYVEAAETKGAETKYRKSYAGSGQKINRAFQDAPPMIPHDTEGMLPIKIGNNACTGCHMPEVAVSMNATPIPPSHFTNFRPTHNFDGKLFTKSIDNYKNEKSIKKTDKLQGARYNCSQCHAPQSEGDLAVENTFTPEYTTPDGASKSHWDGSAFEYGLDTVIDGPNYVTDEDIANKNSAAGSLNH